MVKRPDPARSPAGRPEPAVRPRRPAGAGLRRLAGPARRQQILDRALPVFAATGQAGAGTRQLAAAAGVSEPILYRHFRDKAALFHAVLDDVAARLAAALRQAMVGAGSAQARLHRLAAALPALLQRHHDDLRVLCGAAAAPADAATTRAVAKAYAVVLRVLQRAFAGGGLRSGLRPQTAALFLLELGLGAALLRPAGLPATARSTFGRDIGALLRAALLPAR